MIVNVTSIKFFLSFFFALLLIGCGKDDKAYYYDGGTDGDSDSDSDSDSDGDVDNGDCPFDCVPDAAACAREDGRPYNAVSCGDPDYLCCDLDPPP